MAHLAGINAVKYTTLYYVDSDREVREVINGRSTDQTAEARLFMQAFDSDATVDAVPNVREFPALGTPANIVNVPTYGQSISAQVAGQADAPSLEITLNYDPTRHAKIDTLRRDAVDVVWRVRLTDSTGTDVTGVPADDTLRYDDFYFVGKVASFEVTPSLSDSLQASVSLTINGDFAGPFSSVNGVYGPPA